MNRQSSYFDLTMQLNQVNTLSLLSDLILGVGYSTMINITN